MLEYLKLVQKYNLIFLINDEISNLELLSNNT